MTWFAHRRPDGTVASLHRERQPGYAEEALADDAPEVLAILDQPPPYVPPTPREWMARLSDEKQMAVATAATASPALMLWMFRLMGATFVDVTDAQTIAGVEAVVAAGIGLTADDAALLLAP